MIQNGLSGKHSPLIKYACSTSKQDLALQLKALKAAGVIHI